MNTLIAVTTIMDLTNAALTMLAKAQQVSAIIAKAQAESRDITVEELDLIIKEDDPARVALNEAILKSKGH
jgi:hypothetical protein